MIDNIKYKRIEQLLALMQESFGFNEGPDVEMGQMTKVPDEDNRITGPFSDKIPISQEKRRNQGLSYKKVPDQVSESEVIPDNDPGFFTKNQSDNIINQEEEE